MEINRAQLAVVTATPAIVVAAISGLLFLDQRYVHQHELTAARIESDRKVIEAKEEAFVGNAVIQSRQNAVVKQWYREKEEAGVVLDDADRWRIGVIEREQQRLMEQVANFDEIEK